MSLLIPEKLHTGDKVALVAPSSPVGDDLELSLDSVRFLGLEPVIFESCRASHGYLAGEDYLRAADIMSAFTDDDIKGIFCLKGGYGAMRILPLLDFEIIRKHPKRFFGYSDITALHTAIGKLAGFATFHAPMPTTGYREKDEYTLSYLRRCIFDDPEGRIYDPAGFSFIPLVPGRAEGEIVGGNLDLIASTLGTPYEIDTRGKILFIEEVDRRPWEMDMLLTNLALAGKLNDAEAILLGAFERCDEWEDFPTLEVDDIIREVVVPCGKPVLAGLHAGHTYPQPSIPLGMRAVIDTSKEYIEII